MIGWRRGNFYIRHGQVTDEINITMDTMHLLLEGAAILDERTAGQNSQRISEQVSY
jgi:hypothetical protein